MTHYNHLHNIKYISPDFPPKIALFPYPYIRRLIIHEVSQLVRQSAGVLILDKANLKSGFSLLPILV